MQPRRLENTKKKINVDLLLRVFVVAL